ncbi:MAG: glycogen debranching protein GlgX [Microbacteriaceae bacterium]
MTYPYQLAETPVDALANLGVRTDGRGGTVRVWSEAATAIELCIFDAHGHGRVVEATQLERNQEHVWSAFSHRLVPGAVYALRASGPSSAQNVFHPKRLLLEPYSRGLIQNASNQWRSAVVDDGFDWNGSTKPGTPLDRTVVYEAHVKGISELNRAVPEELRGTYAGLAHEATLDYLTGLGITAIELLPVHAFVSEHRLLKDGLVNYWGYNTLNFFTPHAAYATRQARANGPSAILREFKGMVKLLHEAGLEVILDVVYNHTSEEGLGGPRTSFRGLDNAGYYRLTDSGGYLDLTGCGNTVNFGHPVPQRLVLDSLRYWANQVQVDGFRFDLATVLGRDQSGAYTPEHPLLTAIADDPALADVKMIAEPWDLGPGGWQTGNFPARYSEWNDHFRDRVRDFWLRDIADFRAHGAAPSGIGRFATILAGSSNVFGADRAPLASVNFVAAHDGFTTADLTAYNRKHNEANGEGNRDGTDDNRSFNHGAEGPTADAGIIATRRKAIRNLLGSVLLSAGVPMIVAGDEFGRSQAGNNNAYCHDDELVWLDWNHQPWQRELTETVRHLIALRASNPALRPSRYGVSGAITPGSSQMDWYDASGTIMDEHDWNSLTNRTLQYLASSTPETEDFNRIMLIVHGAETDVPVTLPRPDGVTGYRLLWDSAMPAVTERAVECPPGSTVTVTATSMQLYRCVP